MASMASMETSMTTNSRGLILRVSGYGEKLGVFAQRILESLRDFVPSQHLFDMVKERLIEVTLSARNAEAYSQGMSSVRFHGTSHYPYPAIITEDTLKTITIEDLKKWQDDFRKVGVRMISFFQGNLTKEKAIELTLLTSRTLSLPVVSPKNIILNNNTVPPHGVTLLDLPRFGDDKNNAVIVELTCSVHDTIDYNVNNVYAALLRNYLHPLAFNELRTKQQLGYVVFVLGSSDGHSESIEFLVQSDTYDPEYVTARINEFRSSIPEVVDKITNEEFKGLVDSYIVSLSKKDNSVLENSDLYWGEMLVGTLEFRSDKKLIALAKQAKREEFIEYAKKYLPPDVPDQRCFICRIWGEFKTPAEAEASEKKVKLTEITKALGECMFHTIIQVPHKILLPDLEIKKESV